MMPSVALSFVAYPGSLSLKSFFDLRRDVG